MRPTAQNAVPGYGSREDVRADYAETNSLYRALVDIRFRLLAFVPTVSGAAIAILGGGGSVKGDADVRSDIGLLGLLVTLGVIIYEVRNSQVHDHAIHRLKCRSVRLQMVESLATRDHSL